jgi:hypothetical protein
MKKKLKLALLPHDLFSPGFVFFDGDTKRLANASRPRPMMVHNNWIVGQAKEDCPLQGLRPVVRGRGQRNLHHRRWQIK